VRTDAKHQSAPKAEKVRIGAESFRTAPIGTYPALVCGTGETTPDRWALTLRTLAGEPMPELPAMPGRRITAPEISSPEQDAEDMDAALIWQALAADTEGGSNGENQNIQEGARPSVTAPSHD
jgi:hypothetical protein